MKKLEMKSPDLTMMNIERIGQLFPNAITEAMDNNGNLKKAIDFDLLRQELSSDIVDGEKERYQLTWPGKKEAILNANTPINKTLRPVKEDSVDWDTTQNLYIEGDNLEVLKLLQESYLNKIKCIYIDPPYNTGSDFVYRDNFSKDKAEYNEESGQIDEEGNRLFQNTESNGRFHSDWLTMMYPRLRLARNLLSDDGVIFISIDDNEISSLRKISDEIFGADNFVSEITLVTGANQSGDGIKIQKNTEYCIVYAKNFLNVEIYRVDKTEESLRNLNDAPTPLETRDEMGYSVYYNKRTGDMIPVKDYNKEKIYLNNENEVYETRNDLIDKGYFPIRPGVRNKKLHRWRWGIDTFEERKDEIVIQQKDDEKYSIFFKQSGYNPPKNIINFTGGAPELKVLFDGDKFFEFPKSYKYLKYLLSIGIKNDDLTLDFFSGSATTAHAVMQLNAEDGGKRRYIMVQLPEETPEDSEAFKAGYKNICEIGKERIRRAGKKIKEETKADIDYGFRVFRVDSSNMKDVYYTPDKLRQDDLFSLVKNTKDDRIDEDLLTQIMLEFGLELSLPIETRAMSAKKVFFVAGNSLAACFEKEIPESVIREIAAEKPLRTVFRDSSFKNDAARINVEEIFKMISPSTEIRVI